MEDEFNKLKDDHSETKQKVALLEQSSKNMMNAIYKMAETNEEVSSEMRALTASIDKDRIRRVEREKNKDLQYELLQTQIHQNALDLNEIRDTFKKTYEDSLKRLIVSQGRWDRVLNSMFGSTGKSIWVIIVLAAMYFLGINPSDFTGK